MATADDAISPPAGPRREPLGHYLQVLFGSALTWVWSQILAPSQPSQPSVASSDNLQRAMNLVMPLRHPLVATRAELAELLAVSADEILVGLNNVGTVHFARFDIIDGNLCMLSIYDGEISGYIRDFIAAIGESFDAIMGFVKDPPPTPVGLHVDEFLAWIDAHDTFQLPEVPTDVGPELVTLQRDTLVLLHRNPNVMLGVYRGYPGFSAAQIRDRLSIGW